MSTIRRIFIVVVVAALVAAACGNNGSVDTTTPPPTTSPSNEGDVPMAEFVRADVARLTTTDVTADELAALVAGNDAFAFDLFAAAAEDENLILSPYSIATALTMTYAGARATTADEMRTALHLQLLDDRIHAARNELDLQITVEPEPIPDDERQPFTIRPANSIWGQPGYPFLDAFLELLASEYGAGLRLADFVADPDAARIEINDWVEEQTEGRIVDLIPDGAIDSLTRLVLVNAIWFKANWMEPFDPELTIDAPFTLLDGTSVDVPMMTSPDRQLAFADLGDSVAVRLPYTGDASMLLVVPDQGRFEDVIGTFDAAALDALDDALGTADVNLAMPRFEFRTNLNLNALLRQLGIEDAFEAPSPNGGADFTGMTAERELFISDVVHQAFIAVDEEGTEAAAATAVIMRLTSGPVEEPINVTVDRPFLFLIRHDSTGEILFVGQVTNPAGT